MVYYKRNRNYRKMAKTSKPMKKMINKAVSKVKATALKKVITTVLNRKSELKIAQQIGLADNVQISGTGLFYDASTNLRGWSSGYTIPGGIIPPVNNGLGEADKTGNKIRPKALRLNYILQANPTTDSTFTTGNTNPFKGVPFRVRIIVYKHKYDWTDPQQNNILQNGNSSNSFGSGIDNFFRPYNKDEYTIAYSKTVRMAACKHVSGATGNVITTENVPNGSQTIFAASAKIPLPTVLKYNDGGSIPNNAGYFVAVCLCNEDSTPDSAGLYKRVSFSAESQMTFYDD